MKKYIVCDEYSNYKQITDEKGLKEFLVEDLKRDTFESGKDDFEIVKNNFKVMEKLMYNDYTFDYLKEQLMSFGWYILDLTELQNNLASFQAYKNGVGCPIIKKDCIEETLELIESEMK